MVFIYVLREDFIAKTFYFSSGQCQPPVQSDLLWQKRPQQDLARNS